MKIGKRYSCDRCGRIESPSVEVHPNPTDPSKHLCNDCRKLAYSQSISAVAQKDRKN